MCGRFVITILYERTILVQRGVVFFEVIPGDDCFSLLCTVEVLDTTSSGLESVEEVSDVLRL